MRCSIVLFLLAASRGLTQRDGRGPHLSRVQPGCRNFRAVHNMGLGKSGLHAARQYFHALGYPECKLIPLLMSADKDRRPIMERVIANCSQPYYAGEHFFVMDPHNRWWTLTHLHDIREQLTPHNVLFVLSVRSAEGWVSSVAHWNNMQQRLARRDIDGLPPGIGGNPKDLAAWYEGYNAYVKFFFAHRHNFLLINASSPDSLSALYDFCGDRKRVYPGVGANNTFAQLGLRDVEGSEAFARWRAQQQDVGVE